MSSKGAAIWRLPGFSHQSVNTGLAKRLYSNCTPKNDEMVAEMLPLLFAHGMMLHFIMEVLSGYMYAHNGSGSALGP